MTGYLLRRLTQLPVTLFAISVVIFALIHLAPGDPVAAMMGPLSTAELEKALRTYYELDRPLHEQYLSWLGHVVQGDLGKSIRTSEPVLRMILERFPATLTLATLAMALALTVSLPAGTISALRRNTWVDRLIMLLSLVGFSIPNFVLAIIMILVLGVWLRWLPISGTASILSDPARALPLYVMPTLALGAYYTAILARFWRSSLLDVMGRDYIRVAYAKGLWTSLVVRRHALKNSIIPIITVVAINFAYLLGGAVVIEQIFTIPGIGSMLIQAVVQRDFPVIQGITLVVALFFIVSNLVADVLYAWADPRIKY